MLILFFGFCIYWDKGLNNILHFIFILPVLFSLFVLHFVHIWAYLFIFKLTLLVFAQSNGTILLFLSVSQLVWTFEWLSSWRPPGHHQMWQDVLLTVDHEHASEFQNEFQLYWTLLVTHSASHQQSWRQVKWKEAQMQCWLLCFPRPKSCSSESCWT